jgi:phenylpyruvate tautomerase PptA (4-oxalocrotonate tautomerase family)
MPLVRISIRQGKPKGFGKKIGAVVYRTIVDTIAVPLDDNFQVITEHDPESLVYDPGYLGIRRSDGIVIVQITMSEGRTVEAKQRLFKTLAERLYRELDIRMEDVFVNLVEVKKENWSFGNGIAQYVQPQETYSAVQPPSMV